MLVRNLIKHKPPHSLMRIVVESIVAVLLVFPSIMHNQERYVQAI